MVLWQTMQLVHGMRSKMSSLEGSLNQSERDWMLFIGLKQSIDTQKNALKNKVGQSISSYGQNYAKHKILWQLSYKISQDIAAWWQRGNAHPKKLKLLNGWMA
jgi:hypothetical protein